jgi:hypothetical protein
MDSEYGIIYLIRYIPEDTIVYVGQTTQSGKKRWTAHKTRDKQVIDKAIKKHNPNNFEYIEFMKVHNEDLDYYEKYFIEQFDTLTSGQGYNVGLGGNSADKITTSTRLKLKKNGEKHSKPIYSINLETKEVKLYKSIKYAAETLELSVGTIVNVLKRRIRTYREYTFCYKHENPKDLFCLKKHEKPSHLLKPVELHNLKTDKYLTFKSIQEACKSLNLDPSSVTAVCYGRKNQTKGFRVRYLDSEYKASIKKAIRGSKKRILAISPDDIKICFLSLKDAANYLGTYPANISRVCLGKTVNYKDWYFWYLETD